MLEQMRKVVLEFVLQARDLLRAMLIASVIVPFFGNRRSFDAKPIRVRSRLITSSMSDAIENREIGLQPDRRTQAAAESGWQTNGTCRPRPAPPAIADQLLDPPQHLLRRPPREGQQQNRAGRHATLDQPRHPINQRARLARACARHHQQRALAMGHRGELGRVQQTRHT